MDPTELRSEHCVSYLEPSNKKRIVKYQNKQGLPSLSDAIRELAMQKLDDLGL